MSASKFLMSIGLVLTFGQVAQAQDPLTIYDQNNYSGGYAEGAYSPLGDELLYPYDAQDQWQHGYIQYMPFYGAYKHFRPYNYKQVASQTQAASGWGMSPKMPYSQQYWHRYHAHAKMGHPTGGEYQSYIDVPVQQRDKEEQEAEQEEQERQNNNNREEDNDGNNFRPFTPPPRTSPGLNGPGLNLPDPNSVYMPRQNPALSGISYQPEGASQYGQPQQQYRQQAYNQPHYGQPNSGQQQYTQSQYTQPQYSQPQQGQGQQRYSQPQYTQQPQMQYSEQYAPQYQQQYPTETYYSEPQGQPAYSDPQGDYRSGQAQQPMLMVP